MSVQITGIEPSVVKVNHRGDWVMVQIHTTTGHTGLGEASHSGNDALLVAFVRELSDRLRGRDPQEINMLCAPAFAMGLGKVQRTAWSAIEQALWDLKGQALGAPIHALFGGAVRKRIRLYANINRSVRERRPQGFAAAARAAVAEGFTAVKLAPFDQVSAPDRVRSGPRAAWQAGVACVLAVREAIGPDVELMVDCHGRFDEAEAEQVALALSEAALTWFEEPVPDSQPDALAALSARLPMATASGEHLFGWQEFMPFISRPVVDVLMPDVKHDGGLQVTRQVAEAAAARGRLIAPHNPSGPVAMAATGQVASSLGKLMFVEYAWGEVPWRHTLLEPPEQIEGGDLLISDRPGLGHRLNAEVLAQHGGQIRL
ncbi:MAG: mandelate racemase/muconate lactonizing enzyme family protein [Anaerolineae bacterium]|jgi:galactonate dehydratase|nr:mandelate racemase/muconate lactonizing enzyme family protein [Chloroflexota bacterium]